MSRLVFHSLMLLLAPAVLAGHRYHASAVALGSEGAQAVASVSLPATGGSARNAALAFDDGFVRFADAVTEVHGWREGTTAVTTTEVAVRNLEIGGRIHADLVVTKINERHAANTSEARITFEGSKIEGLTIDGVAVNADLDLGYFASLSTFEEMAAAGVSTHFGTAVCSAWRASVCASEKSKAWTIEVPGLGVLTIGEVFVSHGHRQLNMLRLDPAFDRPDRPFRVQALDSAAPPTSVVVASGEGNGTDFLP